MVNQYSGMCNNLITTSAQHQKSVFVCGSVCSGEQFATYLPPVNTWEVSAHTACWKQNINRKAITLNPSPVRRLWTNFWLVVIFIRSSRTDLHLNQYLQHGKKLCHTVDTWHINKPDENSTHTNTLQCSFFFPGDMFCWLGWVFYPQKRWRTVWG